MRLLGLVCALLCLAAAGRGADFPNRELPQGLGVNIHFTRGHERDLDLIAAAGFKFIRMDFSWGGTERLKGQYRWTDYDELSRDLDQRGLGAVFILDYSNGLYEKDNASPQHPESVAAFARWAGAAAAHFKGHRIIWEIWNEPNISFWKPKPDVHQYIALARATCQAIRQNDPQATIMAPASSEFPWEFFEELFKAGLLEHLDGVSVHPYRNYQRGPETAAEDYLKLRCLIERYAPPAMRSMPILSGEWGYATHRKGVSLETQAAFAVRQQLANLLNGVPLSIWYDWKNDGPDPDDAENNFGTVDPELRPKPAYTALQVMTRELAGYRIAHRLDVGQPEAYVVLLVNAAGDQKLAVWSTRGEPAVNLEVGLVSAEAIPTVDGRGQPQNVTLHDRQLRLTLAPLPAYLTFKERSPALSAAAAWHVREPFARSLKAGTKDALSLAVALQNPFPHAVRVEATLALPDQTVRKTIKLSPGKAADLKLAGPVSRRDLPEVPVTVAVAVQDPGGKLIGRSAETVRFAVANPLQLSVAPAQHAMRITVEAAPGGAFSGYLAAGQERRPVSLTPSQPTASLELPLAAGSEHTAGPFDLLAGGRQRVAQAPAVKFHVLGVTNYLARLDGDANVQASATIQSVPAPGDHAPYSTVYALDYRFDEGWRFARCEAASEVRLQDQPAALGVWVYGDNSGNFLRIRVRDAAGQTFQPGGPTLNWTGWRWVTFDLKHLDQAGHWGGPNDGVVKEPLSVDTALLLDGTRHKTSGRIYFAGLTVLY